MQDLGLFTGESLTKHTCTDKSTHTKNRKDGPFYTRISFDTQDFPPRCTTPLQRCQRWTSVWGQTQYVTFDPSQTLEQHIILLVDHDEHACVWECESVSWCLCLALTLVTCAFFPFCGRERAVYPAETHIQLEYGSDSFQTDSIQVVKHTAKNSWSNKVCCELLLWISANLVANLVSHEHNVLISD